MAERVVPQVLLPRQESPIHVDGGTAYVALGRGQEAICDLLDLPIVQGRPWRMLTTPSGHAYAYAGKYSGGKQTIRLMHRVLLSAHPGQQVDHINGDGLDNRRCNIRIATPSQNQANKAVDRRNKLGVKGVSKRCGAARKKPFVATITHKNKKINLGNFASAEEASAAYLGAAKILWGKFARVK